VFVFLNWLFSLYFVYIVHYSDALALLLRMGLRGSCAGDELVLHIPITRSDVFHQCDIAEDVAIA
jgi:phenylalanyl-tRNA synthetase beta subunit